MLHSVDVNLSVADTFPLLLCYLMNSYVLVQCRINNYVFVLYQLQKVRLPRCGHVQLVPCSVAPFDFKCKASCDQRLSCGHPCQNKCGEDHTRQCGYGVVKQCPIGHDSMVK